MKGMPNVPASIVHISIAQFVACNTNIAEIFFAVCRTVLSVDAVVLAS